MNTYALLYLFVKLDDIRGYLNNNYGLAVTFLIVGIMSLSIIAFIINEEGKSEKIPLFLKYYGKRFAVVFVLLVGIQIGFNLACTLLPSTGQMAAIYLGGKAAESNTADILAKLPGKYAMLLDSKADEWLSEQLAGKVKNLQSVQSVQNIQEVQGSKETKIKDTDKE